MNRLNRFLVEHDKSATLKGPLLDIILQGFGVKNASALEMLFKTMDIIEAKDKMHPLYEASFEILDSVIPSLIQLQEITIESLLQQEEGHLFVNDNGQITMDVKGVKVAI